jgi:hypothetical protein
MMAILTASVLQTHVPFPYPVVKERTRGNAKPQKEKITIRSLEMESRGNSDVRPITSIRSRLAANFGQN